MSRLRFAQLSAAVVLAIGCSAAVAGATVHATLKTVLPANHHAQNTFSFKIKGTFAHSQLTGTNPKKAYVITLRQPSSYACRSTEPKDWLDVIPSRTFATDTESTSPFTWHNTWTGFGNTGERLCSYLYSQRLTNNAHAGAAKLLASSFATLPH